MIDGHGDDLHNYPGIRLNFSSNIPTHTDLSALEAHLCSRISLIRSYPEPSPRSLEEKLAGVLGREPSEVLVTSGATEAIYLVAQSLSPAFPQGERTYTVVHPTFSEYDSASRMFGLRPVPPCGEADSSVPHGEGEPGGVCWLCNPNNPTGEVFGADDVRRLARRHRWLVIDQSYEDYTLAPLPRVDDLPNVIVLHSMTKKYGIPGLRLGYVTGPADVVARLRCQCRPWAVNALALEAGKWLLDQPSPRHSALLAEARRLRAALGAIPGIEVRPTQTNFMLCTIAGHSAAELKDYLARRHGILIRDAANFPGLTPHHFRVAAQWPEANDELINALMDFLC